MPERLVEHMSITRFGTYVFAKRASREDRINREVKVTRIKQTVVDVCWRI